MKYVTPKIHTVLKIQKRKHRDQKSDMSYRQDFRRQTKKLTKYWTQIQKENPSEEISI